MERKTVVTRVLPVLSSIAISLLLLSAYLLEGVGLDRGPRLHTFHRENVLGTSFEFKAVTATLRDAERAEAAAVAEIERDAGILSAYDPASEFRRWFQTAGRPVRVSPELYETLSLFDQWRVRTNGALDASAETICRTWKQAAAEQRLPNSGELAAAVASVRQAHWKLDADGEATHLTHTPLALNSFAKSYIVDRAANAAMAAGHATGVVVNIGGDLVVRGAWTEPVHIADPLSDAENSDPIARLMIRDRAVATSGNYRRGVEIGGRHYSHIVDPRTGQAVDHILSATVVAPKPADAGALATAFSVMTPEESRRLAATMPGVEFLLVQKDGKRVMSPGWHALEAPATHPALTSSIPAVYAADQESASGAWNPAFELTVTLELARIGFARQPYVAVWVEDQNRFPVRTLALWYRKPRWLPELRAWYRDDQVRERSEGTGLAYSISSATRSPGRYTLKWDGKDNQGKFVKAGKYTVFIEAAREHGTYQLMRQPVDFNGAPQQFQLPGNTEVASAELDYHKTNAR
jgi:FAD:protein FMN transferase